MNKPHFKSLLLCLSLFAFAPSLFAQYGNEWIAPNQSYFKIKVGSNGIYKIDQTTLANAGVPVGSINPVNLQIFKDGEEQFIYVSGEVDNSFDAADFIEFYGEYNDGRLDTDMYRTPQEQPHKYISLFNDTTNYFLTWTASTPGKRMTQYANTNFTGKTSDAWVWYSSYYFNPRFYTDGSPYSSPGYFSEFTTGEGWFTDYAYNTRIPQLPVPTPAYNSAGPSPECTFGVYGLSNPEETVNGINHKVEVSIGATKIFEKFFYGYSRVEPGFNEPKVTLASSLIGANTTTLQFATTYLSRGRMSVSEATIKYPRNLDMLNSGFFEFDYQGANDFFSFSNFNGAAPYIYDLTNKTRINGSLSGSTVRFNTSKNGTKKLVIADQSAFKSITAGNVEAVNFSNSVKTLTQSFDFIIITNKKLSESAAEYKIYRESPDGGSRSVLIAYAEDIYNEFFYGLHHPKALRNFSKFLYEQQSTPPQHLLLLGKGQSLDLVRFDESRRKNEDLVPTWGIPPSDYFFVTDYNGVDLSPAIPIGRVPARTDQDVRNYLYKVKLYEQYNNKSKKILYLTGGTGLDQQKVLARHQNNYFQIAKAPKFGAEGIFINKSDASEIDASLTEVIQDQINEGVNMVGYFGHGASQVLELDMGTVEELNNEGKYPLFLFNGCALANSFGDVSLPENFLLHEKYGGVAWIATSAYGFIDPLYQWTRMFYGNAYNTHYGKSIGEIIKHTHKTYQDPNNNFNRSQCRQMLFHGDPALKLYAPDKPDYTTIINPITATYPTDVNAELDSFALILNLRNNGLATNDTPSVYVSVRYSNDSVATFGPQKFTQIYNNETVYFWIKNSKYSRGYQTHTITIDYGNAIEELSPLGESNNTITHSFFMPSTSLSLLSPSKDAIVSKSEVSLKVQVSNILSESNEVLFEVDTTPKFNSPLLQQSGIVTGTNIIEHKFILAPSDSTDFFWRARFNKTVEEGGVWETGTFSLIYNSPKGWSQGYYSKLQESNRVRLTTDILNHKLNFKRSVSEKYDMFLAGIDLPVTSRGLWIYPYKSFGTYTRDGLEVVAINPDNLSRFSEEGSLYNQYVSGRWNYGVKYHTTGEKSGVYIFSMTSQTVRDSFTAYINRIPDEYWVFVVLHADVDIETWDETTYQSFELLGATKIRAIKHGEPYGLIGRKGVGPVESKYEATADYSSSVDPKSQTTSISAVLFPLQTNGDLVSQKIGPSKLWKQFYYRQKPGDSPMDTSIYSLIFVDTAGIDTLYYPDIATSSVDLSSVDAKKYPYAKISTYYSDPDLRTPQEQKRWTILYDGVPEGSLMPKLAYEQSADTLQEGDSLTVKIAYQNISALPMDSVLVLAINRKANNEIDTISLSKYAPIGPDESFVITNKISTLGLTGLNRMTIFVNPNFNQPEERLDNNVIDLRYLVLKDDKNPLLDVVFDGVHILDYDIVSPNLVITISALDDNKYLFIKDPELFEVTMQSVNDAGIPFGTIDTVRHTLPNVTFTPASAPGDKALMEYIPTSLASGKYVLNVSVKDASGNASSTLKYSIHFEVIRESKITNFYPYPNPFTTSVKFVYTLTGEKVPDYLKIQILTVTGKVVREIIGDELGYIKLGNNISEYAWPGTDEYGDQLANGVYLYRVIAKIDGKAIEQRETAGDKFFNQGFGKLYLMR
jgi:hypothetical protein